MENLGYKDGANRRRGVARTASTVSRNETETLMGDKSKTNGIKLIPLNLPIKRRNTKADAMIEMHYPTPGDFEYMECGPSPEAENAPNMYTNFKEESPTINMQIGNDTLRINLKDQMINAAGRMRFFDDIEHGDIIAENLQSHFESASQIEKNLSYLWAAFLKRWDLLEGFLEIGAELSFSERQNGLSALHLGAFSNCLSTVSFLVGKGINVDLQPKYYTPLHCAAFGNATEAARFLIINGAQITKDTSEPNCEESLLHCAVRSNALECLHLFIAEGADINSLKPNGTNAIHLAAELGNAKCLLVLLNSPRANPNIHVYKTEKESTALHLAADEGHAECVDLLLAKGADAKLKNHRGLTALHLAARTSSLYCVESLLRNGNADPNALDFDHRTCLHAAIGRGENTLDVLEMLIQWGANINHRDIYGLTALHIAALDGLAQCVEMLIFHGADVTTKSKKGTTALNVITRKTPTSIAMIRQKLDTALTIHQSKDPANREVDLELDFRQLIQYSHPREMAYLNTFVDEGQKDILEHPLCSAFLYIKWEKIRKFYIARLCFCFTFVLFLSLYVLTALAHNCYNSSKEEGTNSSDVSDKTIQAQELCQKQSILGDMLRDNPFVMEMQWWVLVAITIAEIFRKLCGTTGYSSVKHYVTHVENLLEWFVIISVFAISYIYTNQTYTFQNHIGAFAVLFGWTNLMLMVGQLPVFDVYVVMYRRVQAEFAKLFMAYSCVLIGFALSFCVIFPSFSFFSNPLMGFITVITLMIGELELELLTNDPDGKDPPFSLEISAQITFVLFLLFITIGLMNLLIAIAVQDIKNLKKTSGLSKLECQTKLISYIESALFMDYVPAWLKKMFLNSALVSPQPYRVVLSVKPLNPYEKRLPKDVLMKAYEVGKMKKYISRTVTSKNSMVTYKSQTPYPLPGETLEAIHFATLTHRMDDNTEHIEILTQEMQELKQALISQQQQASKVVDKLLFVIANQQNDNLNK